MKHRFDIKYQLFFNEKTGVSTCRLVDINMAKWINDDTCPLAEQVLLQGAINVVCFRYRKQGWPETHAIPSATAKVDPKFGLTLAKKRLLHQVLLALNEAVHLQVKDLEREYRKGLELAQRLDDYTYTVYESKHDLYVKAAKAEGDTMYINSDKPDDAYLNICQSMRDAMDRCEEKGVDNG